MFLVSFSTIDLTIDLTDKIDIQVSYALLCTCIAFL